MRRLNRNAVALVGIALAASGSLSQCGRDIAERIVPDRSYEAFLQEGFGAVRTKRVGTNEDGGAILEVEVTSTAPKSWLDAELLLMRKAGCGEGRSHTEERITPEAESPFGVPHMAEMERQRPAGTRFLKRLSCEGPLPGAIALDQATSVEDADSVVASRIGGRLLDDPDGVANVVTVVTFGNRFPKYVAFDRMLGSATKNAFRSCGGPVVLQNVATAVLPPIAGDSPEYSTGRLVVGLDLACASSLSTPGQAATPSP